MKECKRTHTLWCYPSLYPTWFRWKRLTSSASLNRFLLYIPHGSDESNEGVYRYDISLLLYIPHGSDESPCCCYAIYVSRNTLYPTWFRWKSLPLASVATNSRTLYPTWFRWKKYKNTLLYKRLIFFISHMVQMKAFLRAWLFLLLLLLYIPHGSDERIDSNIESVKQAFFISHMVQMKVREKCPKPLADCLYIPHGSDER